MENRELFEQDDRQAWNAANIYVLTLGQRLSDCVSGGLVFCGASTQKKAVLYSRMKLELIGLITLMRASSRFDAKKLDELEQKLIKLPINYEPKKSEWVIMFELLPEISKLFAVANVMEQAPQKIDARKKFADGV